MRLPWRGAFPDSRSVQTVNFRPIRIVAPTGPVMAAFDQFSRPLYRKRIEHERESPTLADLRGMLLPKLIFGELRLRDAKRFLKERGL